MAAQPIYQPGPRPGHQPGLQQPGTYTPGPHLGGPQPSSGSGKGKTWIVVALVVVLVLALGGLVGVLVLGGDEDDETPAADTTEETSEPTDDATTEPTDDATTEPTESPTTEPTESATTEPTEEPSGDTPGELLAVGESAEVGNFVVTVDEVVQDGDDVIADALPENPKPAGQYVVVDLTVLYEGRGQSEPFIDLQSNFVAADGTEHAYYECAATTANPGYLAPSLRSGDSTSYQICYDVPVDAVADGHLAFFDLADYGGPTVDWALE